MFQEKIIDINTGEEFLRDYTSAEILEAEKIAAEAAERLKKENDLANVRKAILEKLGLTAEEAEILLG